MPRTIRTTIPESRADFPEVVKYFLAAVALAMLFVMYKAAQTNDPYNEAPVSDTPRAENVEHGDSLPEDDLEAEMFYLLMLAL